MTTRQLIETLECECKPYFTWKTKSTYKTHIKNKTHQAYMMRKQEKEHRMTITAMQNKISKLTIEVDIWKDQCIFLKEQNNSNYQQVPTHDPYDDIL